MGKRIYIQEKVFGIKKSRGISLGFFCMVMDCHRSGGYPVATLIVVRKVSQCSTVVGFMEF